ncbi:MAG: hypothetical protein HKN34_06325 [Gammaproteobacteria bacterium]|nr:hypothetical protein [Gammaproteobacteria bacterium]
MEEFSKTDPQILYYTRPVDPGLARSRFSVICLFVVLGLLLLIQQAVLADDYRSRFHPVRPAHYIAALAEPDANSGDHAETWGYWPLDPGPRGVRLDNYEQLLASDGVAPANWQFDSSAWWLEENGLIMEAPKFPLPPGDYLVTGGRTVLSVLSVFPADASGNQRWQLADNASIHDVTHLGCRSAVYTPSSTDKMCTPENAPRNAFRVAAGDAMPHVAGCNKQDYAVLIVVGLPIDG